MMSVKAKRQPDEIIRYNHNDLTWVKVAVICATIVGSVGTSLNFVNKQWERQFDFLNKTQQSQDARTEKRFEEVTQRFDKVDERFDKIDERLDSINEKLDVLVSKTK